VPPLSPRALRRILAGVLLAVLVAVAWSLRGSFSRSEARTEASPSPQENAAPQETRTTGLVLRSFKEGEQNFLLEAESSLGREGDETRFRGVKVTFGFVADGKPQSSVVTSDECRFDAALPRADFKGHVVLTTSDGFEFRSDSLIYSGDKQVARTEDPAQFRRKAISGSSTGLVYSAAEGILDLPADVFVRIESDTEPATEIRSRSAEVDRAEGLLRFENEAVVVQGGDRLTASRLVRRPAFSTAWWRPEAWTSR
jgi:LPS export ABC transporter protein LptC